MPLPCPGPAQISLLDLQNEFGGSSPIGLAEYYRNGGYVGSNNTNVPTGGTIGLNNFFCAVNEIIRYITSTSTNVNASNYFTSGEWSSPTPKTLIINPGVIVGATSSATAALTIPGFGGTFKLINNGSIRGGSGDGGISGSPDGKDGGTAINAQWPSTIIDNLGTIYAGGGGAGRGGFGGQGVYYNNYETAGCGGAPGCAAGYYQTGYNGNCGGCCQTYSCGWGGTCCSQNRQCRYCQQQVITSGGTGGNGGRGEGYNLPSGIGQAGTAGGINAGAGGPGGNGGGWGSNGSPGNAGANGNYTAGGPGRPGGLAGYYIQGNGNVTWLNTGTRLGRVG